MVVPLSFSHASMHPDRVMEYKVGVVSSWAVVVVVVVVVDMSATMGELGEFAPAVAAPLLVVAIVVIRKTRFHKLEWFRIISTAVMTMGRVDTAQVQTLPVLVPK